MSNHKVCGQEYQSVQTGEVLACTAPVGHTKAELHDPRRFYHSWEWLRRAEEEEALAVAQEAAQEALEASEEEITISGGPPEIDDLIEGIGIGLYDPYIESLLAALHGRKRSMRSVPHPYGRTDE